MRLVTALLLLAVPTYAAAQSTTPVAPAKPVTPAAPAKAPEVKPTPPAPPKPTTPQPTPPKPTPPKPAAAKPPSAHPAPAGNKPVPPKPAAHKPAPPKPPPPKPVAPVTPPAPAAPEPPPDPQKGSNTGLPLPRFAALKSDDINFRRGPGTRYPIDWVYKRRDLPVQIEREFEVWRLIADPEGSKGWVQAGFLTGRRTGITVGAEHTLRQSASDTAGAVAKLAKGVIVRLRSCEAKSDWCQVQVGDYRGFLKRTEIWGVMPGEAIQ